MVTMSNEKAHQVAVAHCVNGLYNDLVESEAGWKLLGWHCSSPVHPVTALLVKEVVMYAAVLQEKVQDEHSHVYSCRKR